MLHFFELSTFAYRFKLFSFECRKNFIDYEWDSNYQKNLTKIAKRLLQIFLFFTSALGYTVDMLNMLIKHLTKKMISSCRLAWKIIY